MQPNVFHNFIIRFAASSATPTAAPDPSPPTDLVAHLGPPTPASPAQHRRAVLPIPPGIPGTNHLLVQAAAVRQYHLPNGPAIAIRGDDLDGDGLLRRDLQHEALCRLPEGLVEFRAVDAGQSYLLRPAIPQDLKGIAVGNLDDLAGEGGSQHDGRQQP